MRERGRGWFVIDPPAGGLARLREGMRAAPPAGRLPLLPWATAATLLLGVLGVLYRGQADMAARIEEDVRSRQAVPWVQVSAGDQRLYLATPSDLARE